MNQEGAEKSLLAIMNMVGISTLRMAPDVRGLLEMVKTGHDRTDLGIAELVDLLSLHFSELSAVVAEAQRVVEDLLGIRGMPKGENVLTFEKRRTDADHT